MDGSAPVRLGEGGVGSSLSPDGKRVAVNRARANRPNEVVLVPTGPGEERRIEIGSLSAGWVRFLPGAGRLLFAGRAPNGNWRPYVVGLSDGALRPVAPEGLEVLAVSPDGKWVLCQADEEFGLFPLGGGEPRTFSVPEARLKALEDLGILYSVLSWADDDHTVFAGPWGIPGRFFRLDLRTFQATLWKEVTPPDVAGVRAVQPTLITPDGKSYVYTFRRVLSDLYLAKGLR